MKKITRIATVILVAVAAAWTTPSSAQSLKDILNKVEDTVSSITGNSTTANITGTWNYEQPGVKFKSDNLLAKAGGAAASAAAKEKLATYYAKAGLKPGAFTLTFNSDKTFSATIGKRTMSGTYAFENSTLTLKTGKLGKGINIDTSLTSSTLSLLFNVDKLMEFLQTFSSSGNSTLSAIGSLANSYDGMSLGFEMKRK